MVNLGDPIVLQLIEKLQDSDPRTRRNAAGSLRLNGARAVSAIPQLKLLLQDHDPKVREEARRAIRQLCRRVA